MDKEVKEILERMWARIDTINERTKAHTIYIKRLEKRLEKQRKELSNGN